MKMPFVKMKCTYMYTQHTQFHHPLFINLAYQLFSKIKKRETSVCNKRANLMSKILNPRWLKLQLAATHCPRSIILVTWQHYVSWNLPRIMWNSGISREMDYILPNLTYLVSIQPNVIILYTFRVSFDFWSLESGDPEILESPGFGKFQHVGTKMNIWYLFGKP